MISKFLKNERVSRFFISGLFVLLGLLLLVVSVPQFLAEVTLIPGTHVYNRAVKFKAVDGADLVIVEKAHSRSIAFAQMPRAYGQLLTVYLMQMQKGGQLDVRQGYAEKSIEVGRKGLSLYPADAFGWLRLSGVYVALGLEFRQEAIESWRMSAVLAPFEPLLMIERLHVGILLHESMSEENRKLLIKQFELAYYWDKKRLKEYASDHQLMAWMEYLATELDLKNAFAD